MNAFQRAYQSGPGGNNPLFAWLSPISCAFAPRLLTRALIACPFTTTSYCSDSLIDSRPQRDSKYSSLTKRDVDYFKAQIGNSNAMIDNTTQSNGHAIEPFNVDWMGKYQGRSQLVLSPQNKSELSRILQYCNERKLAVVPQGGNTGLVGGSVPVFDEIIISTKRMNKIRSFDKDSGVLVVDAGVILEAADQFLQKRDYVFPLDLGAKGSCHIGGNISTNAGGLRVLRYGGLSGNLLGVEAVLPDGTIFDGLSSLRKDNTGYALKQLFVGSEGTLGVVTGVSILCAPRPKAISLAYLGLESFDQVRQALQCAKSNLGEILSAFEMVDGKSQELFSEHNHRKNLLERPYPFYCLVETRGSDEEHDAAKMERFLDRAITDGIVADGVLAQDNAKMVAMWQWREGVAEVLNRMGGTYKYDFSIPLIHWYQIVEDCRDRLRKFGLLRDDDLSPVSQVIGYGHVGDCNIHLNISVKEYSQDIEVALEPWLYEWIQQHGGSISAEHGLGLAKKNYAKYGRDEVSLMLMRNIRSLYDPVSPHQYRTSSNWH
ncbi:Uncharacterized protein HZ326_22085 [Fusarium oxysporum f. sp. albedinis]|nr:Uncharacterized protein HZ326_22085 [Fusarium oxysporum f. sp. albedinis]